MWYNYNNNISYIDSVVILGVIKKYQEDTRVIARILNTLYKHTTYLTSAPINTAFLDVFFSNKPIYYSLYNV